MQTLYKTIDTEKERGKKRLELTFVDLKPEREKWRRRRRRRRKKVEERIGNWQNSLLTLFCAFPLLSFF